MTNLQHLEKEVWKDITGYEGLYQISSFARVKSLAKTSRSGRSHKIIHTYLEKITRLRIRSGYLSVSLCKKGECKDFSVHRLVALHFIPNPNNKKFVNHKDGNKLNPIPSNLEWCTTKENVIHAINSGLIINPEKNFGIVARKMGLNGMATKVFQFSKTGDFIREWDCISEAAIFVGCKRENIRDAAFGRQIFAKGYLWSLNNTPPTIREKFQANKKRVLQLDLNNNVLNCFNSATDAAKTTKINRQQIGKCCLSKCKTAGGYIWKFKEAT